MMYRNFFTRNIHMMKAKDVIAPHWKDLVNLGNEEMLRLVEAALRNHFEKYYNYHDGLARRDAKTIVKQMHHHFGTEPVVKQESSVVTLSSFMTSDNGGEQVGE